MGWNERLDELSTMRTEAAQGGGPARITAQHDRGKQTARERIAKLVDPGSFQELDAFAQHRCHDFGMEQSRTLGDGVVAGSGLVDGRPIHLYAQDFTVLGGSLGETVAAKICKVMDLALRHGTPLVALNDSGGARIQEGVLALAGYADIFYRNTRASGVIPQLSVILGPCAGGAVYSPGLTDFILMAEGTSHMFITGPEVIKTVTGEEVSFEELGGAAAHASKSGVAHLTGADEDQTLELVRSLLAYLPANNLEDPPPRPTGDPADRRLDGLPELVPADGNLGYDVRELVRRVVDQGEFLEIHEQYARNIVVGFARLDGHPVGVVANQPAVFAGCLDCYASEKGARFVRFCDAFNIPLVTFVDVPGFLPGVEEEHRGIITSGAKLIYAYSEATVPKLTVITRKAYGGAYCAMCSKHLGADLNLAWPIAEIAVMGPAGAVNIVFRKELATAPDKEAKYRELVESYRAHFASPYIAAQRGYVDEVIHPAETRQRLVTGLQRALGKRESRLPRKHGNIPL